MSALPGQIKKPQYEYVQSTAMKKNQDNLLREQLRQLLKGGNAHIDMKDAIDGFPLRLINKKMGNLPYTPWQVLEHLRIAQWDILEFSRNEHHVSPAFPEEYWPPPASEADETTWKRTVDGFFSDRLQMEELVMNPLTDLFAEIPHGDGQTVLREALLVADHNSYHLGALMTMKKMNT